EQLTDEYGIFNLDREMDLVCGEPGCRKRIGPEDFDLYYREWDEKIQKSITRLFEVEQPLMPFIEKDVRLELDEFFKQPELYKSVYALRHRK
ncbi:MAG: SET domain-containing protein-lysine N-methyltransferase, partial [Bacteroidetes bacterium]